MPWPRLREMPSGVVLVEWMDGEASAPVTAPGGGGCPQEASPRDDDDAPVVWVQSLYEGTGCSGAPLECLLLGSKSRTGMSPAAFLA